MLTSGLNFRVHLKPSYVRSAYVSPRSLGIEVCLNAQTPDLVSTYIPSTCVKLTLEMIVTVPTHILKRALVFLDSKAIKKVFSLSKICMRLH